MMIRMVGGWVCLLVPAHPGSPRQRAIKWLLLLCVLWCIRKWQPRTVVGWQCKSMGRGKIWPLNQSSPKFVKVVALAINTTLQNFIQIGWHVSLPPMHDFVHHICLNNFSFFLGSSPCIHQFWHKIGQRCVSAEACTFWLHNSINILIPFSWKLPFWRPILTKVRKFSPQTNLTLDVLHL